MAKYEGLCPKNYEINLYGKCSFNCAYCIAKNEKIDFIDNINSLNKKLLNNKSKDPVYISPWTDAYQQSEEKKEFTREAIKILNRLDYPYFIITRSNLVLRDIDIIKKNKHTFVAISINTLDGDTIKKLEPGTSAIEERMKTIKQLIASGIRTVIKIDPIIPGITDGDKLNNLISWIIEIKPHAVTADTLRLTSAIANNLKDLLSPNDYDKMISYYDLLNETPSHPENFYRLNLLKNIAEKVTEKGIKASFCKASLPEKITPFDCRGGY